MRPPLAQTSVRDALDSAVIALTAVGCETPRLDAELLLAAAMGVDRAAIVADPERGLDPDAARRFMEYAARRRDREPVAYILGTKGFRSIDLAVDPRVLIPRPETEHLVEAVLDLPRGARVCDVGTGSGAIALSIADEHPGARVVAVDRSAAALGLARENLARTGLAGRIELRHGDLLDGVRGPFDLVVSNPPYVSPEEYESLQPEIRLYEPVEAVVGEGVWERIAGAARTVLPAGARLVLECGDGQAAEVAAGLARLGYGGVQCTPDLAGRERAVEAQRP
jgi:release factor glutamine methyltransferase